MTANYWFMPWHTNSAASDNESTVSSSVLTSLDVDAATYDNVDKLLTQFPVYGTNQNNPEPEWLRDGEPTQQEEKTHRQRTDSLATSVHSSSSTDSRVRDDWDVEEQQLWKESREPKDSKSVVEKELHYPRERKQEWLVGTVDNTKPEGLEEKASGRHFSSSASQHGGVIQLDRRHGMPDQLYKQNVKPEGLEEKPSRRHFSSSASQPEGAIRLDRRHWMPDQLCKICYACESQFSVFRRRHHCRLCGQVFCNACSAHFVPSKTGSTVRVCKMCFDQVGEKGGVVDLDPLGHEDIELPPSPGEGGRTPTQLQQQPQAQHHIRPTTNLSVQVVQSKPPQLTIHRTRAYVHRTSLDVFESPQPHQQQLQENTSQRLLKEHMIDPSTNTDSVLSSLNLQRLISNSDPVHNKDLLDLEEKEQEASEQLLHLHARGIIPSEDRATKGTMPSWPAIQPGNCMSSSPLEPASPINKGSVANTSVRKVHRNLGLTATAHLEKMAEGLLRLHAPILFDELSSTPHGDKTLRSWINQLLFLATRCCYTVDPNVKRGDLLDIRPYCKIKVISGGSYQDCAYLSGVLFRKSVSHKRMARVVDNPRLMLLSGGIEFTRTENRFASLETLFEQEDKYTEILVGKILKLRPDVLMVGKSVSRRAQELLLKADVVLIQHVKSSLMNRISRQTGATIISSTDHVMNQFGANVLGNCRRFRLATFRDNEVWDARVQSRASDPVLPSQQTSAVNSPSSPRTVVQRSIKDMLADPNLSNVERQAVLAAKRLGEGVVDGAVAIKSGLARRGVAQTYVMLEGCPKHLGCTVVIRGSSRVALKQVKTILRFLINVAYNLRLETSYLRDRSAIIRPGYEVVSDHTLSSSLCVSFGQPPSGSKVRPWNGGNTETVSRGEITAFDHQAILITSLWMTEKSQCCPAELKGICYYSLQDVALGQFLRDSCFNLSLKCQNPNCKKSVLDHSLSFVHNDGLVCITVEEIEESLPPLPHEQPKEESTADDEDEEEHQPIATWTYCKNCKKVTPLNYISEDTWKFSFGKFLEVFFYNRDAILDAPEHGCCCQLQSAATLYFGCGKLAARFAYEVVSPFGVFLRRSLPIDIQFHRTEAMKRLDVISVSSSNLFVKFDKHIERVSREARSLFNTAVNRPEHLQTVLSELNRIGSEVDHAAKTLQERIASVTDSFRLNEVGTVDQALIRFPWFARRYLFMIMSSWNEKLSAAGQAISAMKRLAASHRSDSVIGPNVSAVVGDPLHDELLDGMKRLRKLNEQFSRYNITDLTQVLPILPGTGEIQPDGDDDDFEDADTSMDFSEVDADVVASRRRLKNSQLGHAPRSKPTKSLGTIRSASDVSRSSSETALSVPAKPTPGGAVKSAITRFFNRGGRENDPYMIDLGVFAEGRPRLTPGVQGVIIPVFDDQLSTIIAYSLASAEYAKLLKHFSVASLSTPAGESTVDTAYPGRVKQGNTLHPGSPVADMVSEGNKDVERQMLGRNKSHVKHTFRDYDEKGQVACKFVCTTYWATQFHAVRQVFLSPSRVRTDEPDSSSKSYIDVEEGYVESLASAYSWAASGGKSGASFARTCDGRFVIKCISRTELQMFLDCAPAYFEYLSKAFFHGLPTLLCKIVGVYQIGVHNKVTGKRSMDQVAVMQNIFYKKTISRIFDLKGSLRGRFAAQFRNNKEENDIMPDNPRKVPVGKERNLDNANRSSEQSLSGKWSNDTQRRTDESGPPTLLDGDFLEFTCGRALPLTDRAKALFQMSILNDTLFLSLINVLDYSILVGVDEDSNELVVGIIDFMRQYDILKQMERVGKSLPMVVGSEAPTIIQPPLYKARFTNAMERYFMTVPSKWTAI